MKEWKKLYANTREAIVDTIVDEKEKVMKLIVEMPGVEKTDVKILVDKNVVDIFVIKMPYIKNNL